MSEGPWWILPLVVVGSILIILYVSLFSLLPIPPSEKLVATGLFLNVCGAVVVLIPDLVGVDKLFEPIERVVRIEEAQNELFLGGSIEKEYGEQAYHELVRILSRNQSFATPDRIAAMSGGYGVSANVYFQYEKDESDIDAEDPNAWQRHESERVGPTGVMDSRVSEYIENLRNRGHQLGFASGIFLLLVGFFSQFAAIIL